MKYNKKRIFLALIFCCPRILSFCEPVKISLEDAYYSALKKTEIISIEESRKKQMDAKIDQAKSVFLPGISAKANYSLQDGDTKVNDQASIALSATQYIYRGGRDILDLSIAKLEKIETEWSLADSRVRTYASVANYFYRIVSLEQDIVNLGRTISQTKDIITELEKRNRIGKTKNSEVLMAQAQLAILQSELKSLQGNLSIIREQFAFLTGLEKDVILVSADDSIPEIKDLEFYLRMTDNRPDIKSLLAGLNTARERVEREKAGGMPSLYLTGNVYPIRTGSSQGVNWDLGLGIGLNIFDGGDIDARIREYFDKQKEADLLLCRQKRQAEAEIKSAYRNFMNLVEQIEVLKTALVTTEKNYKEQQKDYGFSLVTNLDVLQALNTYQNTKRSLDRTTIELKYAWISLMTAVARIPE